MAEYTVNVSDQVEKGLRVVAAKDGITVTEIIQKQLDYYTGTVIRDYIECPVELTEEQVKNLNIELAATKATFICNLKLPLKPE